MRTLFIPAESILKSLTAVFEPSSDIRTYSPRASDRNRSISRERCQIIVITITNNSFRLRYVSSKLDQVLLLLLLTYKL
jgi:hypothetical protein